MKHIFLLTLVAFISIATFAQSTSTSGTNSMADRSKKTLNKRTDQIVVNLNFENWIHNQNNGFKTQWYSRGLDVCFMYDLVIKKSFVSFAPGIGFSTHNVYHNSLMVEDSTGLKFQPIDNFSETFKKSKITINYLEIPLELRFRTKPLAADMRFKVAVGFKFGLRVDAYTKTKRNDLSVDGSYRKYVEKGYKDFNLVRMGPTLRIGYGPFNLCAFYNVLNVFKKDRGPVATTWSAGISINGL